MDKGKRSRTALRKTKRSAKSKLPAKPSTLTNALDMAAIAEERPTTSDGKETKGGVSVVARFRPINKNEKEKGSKLKGALLEISDDNLSVKFTSESKKELKIPDSASRFTFDYVFPTNSTQAQVYQQTGASMIGELFAGFNCTILAYGQTGTGKTWSMMGIVGTENAGVIPRLVENIFVGIENADVNIEFAVEVSYVEIYLEQIKDLLHPANSNLRIRETSAGGIYIQGVTETYVTSNQEVLDIMEQGGNNRKVSSTDMNAESSRSHSVFILKLTQKHKIHGSTKESKLILVDLAGSEKVSKTGATGQTFTEAKAINKSLSALGNVIKALTTGKGHVPYRDSKLTRLLSDSLGGNSKTCLIITGSVASYNAEETLSTLRFGKRAKMIKNKPKVNEERSIDEYKALLEAAYKKIRDQENIIKALKEEGGYSSGSMRSEDWEAAMSAASSSETTAASDSNNDDSHGGEGRGGELKQAGKTRPPAPILEISDDDDDTEGGGGEEAGDQEKTKLLTQDPPKSPSNKQQQGMLSLPKKGRKQRRESSINTIMSLQARCTTLEQKNDEMKAINRGLEDTIADANADMQKLRIQMEEVQGKLSQTENMRKEAVDGVTLVLNKRLTLAQKEAKMSNTRVATLNEELKKLREKLASKQKLADAFMEQTKKSLLSPIVTTRKSKSNKAGSSDDNKLGMTADMEKLQHQNEALMEDLSRKCADMIQMRMELEEYKSEMTRNKGGGSKAAAGGMDNTQQDQPDELAFQRSLVASRDQTINLLEGALHDSNVFARKMFDEYEGKIKSLKSTITKQRFVIDTCSTVPTTTTTAAAKATYDDGRFVIETSLKPVKRMVRKIMGGGRGRSERGVHQLGRRKFSAMW
mmetsp:Transcript_39415/g.66074  ORF Transcript_39415/g.66074 Transcript_39415/m.66074 type:complete len:870 (+) Transcript_39415:176-2785(+)